MCRACHPSLLLVALAAAAAGCGGAKTEARDQAPAPPLSVSVVKVVSQPVTRFISVTGSLTADDEAEVAAETSGRVVATPVERGSQVRAGAELVRLSEADTEAQMQEAEANAAQIAVRLGLSSDGRFDPDSVPEVANARASRDLAAAEFERVRTLFDRMLISKSQFDLSRNQAEAATRQYEVARNGAVQQYELLRAARARLVVARKALADTVVRAPFDGVVAERLVSPGDYVTRGTRVAIVLRINVLRVQLTVPEQYIATIDGGRPVTLRVDAYPDRVFTGQVRYISPAVRPESRALVVEAVVPNPENLLKPGFFATARLEQASKTEGLLVPRQALRASAGSTRLFVVVNGHLEERVVTTGDAVGERVQVTSGVAAGEQVVTNDDAKLSDGLAVTLR